jgi:hypothetical protein
MSKTFLTTGEIAFSNVTKFDVYRGKSTEKYNITITMSDSEAEKLENMGVHVKTYSPEDGPTKRQRKFSSKFPIRVVDLEDNPINTELGRGSVVRVAWGAGEPSEEHGVPTYVNAIRVVELEQPAGDLPDEF